MKATSKSLAADQLEDVEQVAALWRGLGHSVRSVRGYRQWILQILNRAHVVDYQDLTSDYVVHLARSFAREHHHESPRHTRWRWLSAFRAFAWGLQRLGKPVGSIRLSRKGPRLDPVVQAFLDYGRKQGLSPQTIRIRERYLVYLERFLVRIKAPWPVPRLTDLDRFLRQESSRWSKETLAVAACTFRAWLRFLFVIGRSKRDLSSSLTLPPLIAFPRPARALPWDQVLQLGRGIDRSTPIGKRDHAQYLLFCAYGLSNAEVIDLKLEAIDWDAGILHIRRTKNSSTVDLPLLPDVAQAIAEYLRHGRPTTVYRHVFVRHAIPFGPLGHATVGQRVRCWAKRAGVEATFLGAHLFRHSFATYQLERGLPLKVIGDILGHRSHQTTGIYVRTALERLRQLALPIPT